MLVLMFHPRTVFCFVFSKLLGGGGEAEAEVFKANLKHIVRSYFQRVGGRITVLI